MIKKILEDWDLAELSKPKFLLSSTSFHDPHEKKEELVEKREEKIWRINKRSMTNEDVDEGIKERRVLELFEGEIGRINDCKL